MRRSAPDEFEGGALGRTSTPRRRRARAAHPVLRRAHTHYGELPLPDAHCLCREAPLPTCQTVSWRPVTATGGHSTHVTMQAEGGQAVHRVQAADQSQRARSYE